MPCTPTATRDYQVWPVDGMGAAMWGGLGGFYPVISGGVWRNVGGCSCCDTGCEVDLPGPVAEVIDVTIAGEVVDPDAYQVHDAHLLVRIDGGCWPACVNFGRQDPPDFTVTYTRGAAVPTAVLEAAAVLACEFGRACTGGVCRLPSRVSSLSRQGIDVQFADLTDLFASGLTGLDEVDRVILTVNPGRLHSPPQVWTPDLPPPRMVTQPTVATS